MRSKLRFGLAALLADEFVPMGRQFFAEDDGSGGGGPPPAPPAGDEGSLLSPAPTPPPAPPPEPPAPMGAEYDFEADPLGLGNVPFRAEDKEYLAAGKYKGATVKEVMQHLTKAYGEAQKLISQKGLVPPENYDLTGEAFASCDDTAKAQFAAIGKTMGLTQAQLEKFVAPLAELRDDIATQKNETLLAQSWGVEKGSPQYLERIGKLERWAAEAIRRGVFTADQIYAKGTGLASSVGGVHYLESVMNRHNEKGVWSGDAPVAVSLTLAEAKAYLLDDKGPYHNATHPDHVRIRDAVDKAYLAQPGASERIL